MLGSALRIQSRVSLISDVFTGIARGEIWGAQATSLLAFGRCAECTWSHHHWK